MRNRQNGSNLEHRISVGPCGDVRQRTSGWKHEVELVLDEVGERFHAIVTSTDANELRGKQV